MQQLCLGYEIETTIDVVAIQQIRESTFSYKTNIRSQYDVVDVVKSFLKNKDREYFIILCLDRKNYINNLSVISIGSVSSAVAHPREVFKTAILSNASSIILAHNHPTGDPEPSKDDLEITKRLVEAGKIIGIEILDHIIVGDPDFISFKKEGLM